MANQLAREIYALIDGKVERRSRTNSCEDSYCVFFYNNWIERITHVPSIECREYGERPEIIRFGGGLVTLDDNLARVLDFVKHGKRVLDDDFVYLGVIREKKTDIIDLEPDRPNKAISI